jgi:hypothetical protein
MTAGYLYVLVNSSMPGLVKVGKTTRLPSDRASELSGVTGVATPFIIAFEQHFSNCDEAESYVHTVLQRAGYREAINREFFRAAPNDVIRVIMGAPGLSDSPDQSSTDDFDLISQPDPTDDLKLDAWAPQPKPWSGVLEEADNHYYGLANYIVDYDEALKLYKDAARLGSLLAYERIGVMHYSGEGVPKDMQKALSFFKEGAKRGNYYCHREMALLFSENIQTDNALKCWNNFFIKRSDGLTDEIEEASNKFPHSCGQYVEFCLASNTQINFLALMSPFAKEAAEMLNTRIGWIDSSSMPDSTYAKSRRKRLSDALNWISSNL